MDNVLLQILTRLSRFMPGLVGLSIAVVLSHPVGVFGDDGVIVADGFEEGAISPQWEQPVFFGVMKPFGSMSVTNTDTYSGTSALQLNWFASNTSSIHLHKGLPKLNEVYLRYAVKWSDGFQFTPGGTKGKKIWRIWVSDTKDDIILLAMKKPGADKSAHKFVLMLNRMFRGGKHPNLLENVGSPTAVETGKWYCFDWHIVGGIGTGSVEGWVNGVKKWDYQNLDTTSAPMTRFDLGGNISPSHPTIDQTEWFDNVSLSTSPITTKDVPACMTPQRGSLVPSPSGLDIF